MQYFFSPYLLAVGLSLALFQSSPPLSCTSGDATLSELAVIVDGEDQIGFDTNQQTYEVWLPPSASTALVRAISTDPAAQVWFDVLVGSERNRIAHGVVGGGEVLMPLVLGLNTLELWVRAPHGATDVYTVAVQVACGDCSDDAFVAGAPVTVSGPSPFAGCESDAAYLDAETEPWVAVNPANPDNIVGAWIQDAGPVTRGHVAGVTFDGGATWESVVIPGISRCSGGEIEGATDPWLAFASNGHLYSVALSFPSMGVAGRRVIFVNKSVDGGLSWRAPVAISESMAPQSADKPAITADPEDACTVHVGWSVFDGPVVQTFVSRTIDCGETWSDPTLVFDADNNGIQIVVAPDGVVLSFLGLVPELVLKRSFDGGVTWSEDSIVVSPRRPRRPVTPDSGKLIRSARDLFDVAIDRQTGDLYAVWEQRFSEAVQVALSTSADGGVTWSIPIRIDQTPPGLFFLLEQAFLPSVEVSDDGVIGVTYYNFQNDVPGVLPSSTDHWFVSCAPAENNCANAASWVGSELRLTEESFGYEAAPQLSNGLFLGDYVGLAPSGSDFVAFFPVTTEDDPANTIFVPIRAR